MPGVLTDPSPARYRLTAFVICHDLKCNLPVEAVVPLPRPPTAGEAAALLWPAAEARLAARDGHGYQFELVGVGVRVADAEPGA